MFAVDSNAIISFPFLGIEINPISYITLFGRHIYLYGIIIGFGMILAVIYACKRAPQFGITSDNLLDVIIFGIPSAIIGARAYYVVFYWDLYKDNWVDVFKIWEGGLAIYGGVIAAVIAIIIVCRVKKISALSVMDITALGLLIGQSIGRWGNFFNREAYGYLTDWFCKMGLTEYGQTMYVHPTFLYESVWNAIGFVILHFYSKKGRKYNGQIFLLYITWYGLGRTFIELLRTDSLYLFNTGLRISHLVGAVTFVVGLILLIVCGIKAKKKWRPAYEANVEAAGEGEDLLADDEVKSVLLDESADEDINESEDGKE